MKEKINIFCFGAIVCLVFIGLIHGCEKKPEPKYKIKTIEVIKNRIDTVKVDLVKWKESKSKIVYKTKFDTLATIDTVLVELAKCDTIVKIDSVIIAKQDTIIKGQEEIIFEQDLIKQHQEKENKKLKRKLIFTKILAGAVVVLTIIASMK